MLLGRDQRVRPLYHSTRKLRTPRTLTRSKFAEDRPEFLVRAYVALEQWAAGCLRL